MVIFNSYVKLPEGKWKYDRLARMNIKKWATGTILTIWSGLKNVETMSASQCKELKLVYAIAILGYYFKMISGILTLFDVKKYDSQHFADHFYLSKLLSHALMCMREDDAIVSTEEFGTAQILVGKWGLPE